MKQTRIHCPYCGSLATLRPASVIHGLSDISAGTYLYVCRRWPACDAYVTAESQYTGVTRSRDNGYEFAS